MQIQAAQCDLHGLPRAETRQCSPTQSSFHPSSSVIAYAKNFGFILKNTFFLIQYSVGQQNIRIFLPNAFKNLKTSYHFMATTLF